MPRFITDPAFRFSLDVAPGQNLGAAIGKWSRGATYGDKSAKGDGLKFTPEILSRMVENAAARGDKVSICADHKSAYVATTGQPAPSLGYFYGLAVFDAGKLVTHWATDGGQPPAPVDEQGQPRDGLYCRLGEITPLGYDPKDGLANYSSLSPMFQPDGQAEDGSAIGYSLIDFGATSTPFQAGCAIQFSNGVHAMSRGYPNKGERYKAKPGSGITNPDAFEVTIAADFDPTSGADYISLITKSGQPTQMLINHFMNDYKKLSLNPGAASAPGTQLARGARTMGFLDSYKAGERVKWTGAGPQRTGRVTRVGSDGNLTQVRWDDGEIEDIATGGSFIDKFDNLGAASAPGASAMNELLKKLGLAEGADDNAKRAAFKSYMGDAAAMAMLNPEKCGVTAGELEAMAELMDEENGKGARAIAARLRKMAGGDEDEKKDEEKKMAEDHKEPDGDEAPAEMAAFAISLGINAKGMKRAQVMDAIKAATVPAAKLPELVQMSVQNVLAEEREKQSAAEKKQRAGVLMSNLPQSYPGDRAALQRLAEKDPDEAEKLAAPFMPKTAAPSYLMTRMTSQGGPIGQSGAREFTGPRQPKIHETPLATFIAPDEELADEIKAVAFSQDPATAAKVRAHLANPKEDHKAALLIAAEKVVKADRPHLFDAAKRTAIHFSH